MTSSALTQDSYSHSSNHELRARSRLLILPRRLQRFGHDIEYRLHLLPLRQAGVQILYAVEAPLEHRHVVFGNVDAQGIDGILRGAT